MLLIHMWPHPSILMFYWFWWYLIPEYRCVIDSHMTSSQHTNVLLILMWSHSSILMFLILLWPHSSILMYYWFSCEIIPAYWNIVDSHGTSFHHTIVLLILMRSHSSILMCYWFSWYPIPAYWCVNDSRVALF